MNHTFSCERLTIGDYRMLLTSAASSDMVGFLAIIAKCYEGDVYALPMAEMNHVLRQFGSALRVYIETAQDADVMRLLKQALGGNP